MVGIIIDIGGGPGGGVGGSGGGFGGPGDVFESAFGSKEIRVKNKTIENRTKLMKYLHDTHENLYKTCKTAYLKPMALHSLKGLI